MITRLYKNITKKKIVLPVTFDEVKPGEVYSITSEYHQPIGLDGMLEITDLGKDEQVSAEKKAVKEHQERNQ